MKTPLLLRSAGLVKGMMLVVAVLVGLTSGTGRAAALDLESLQFPPLPSITLPEVEELTLKNGLRLYLLVDKRLPLVQATARIHGGAFLEPADKIGLAEVCGHLLRIGGTASYTSDQLDDLLEGIGGSVESSIDTTAGRLSMNMLSSHLDLAIEVMAEVLRRPQFEEDRFKQVLLQMQASVDRRNDRPADIATREFDKMIYGASSPYARHPEHATLRAMTRNDLAAFHARMYQPQNVQLAIFGDIERDRVVALVTKAFGDWPRGTEAIPDFPPVDYAFTPAAAVVDLPQSKQSNILIGHLGGRLLDEDHPHRIVMNNVFGVGFGSRLFKEVRSRAGLAYSVFGVFTANMAYPGQFFSSVSTRPDATVKAVRKIKDEIKRLQEAPPTAEELRLGKDRYLNAFVFNFDTMDKIIDRLIYQDFFGLPRDYLNREKERVEAVTADDILAAARKNLKPEALRVLVVGPAGQFDEPLGTLGLGAPETLDITIPKVR
jgi:zinc protease